jgi:hypothetical protein
MNIYEQSCRMKLRWNTTKGNLTIEDLLSLSLQSLDRIGKTVLQEIRNEEESFIQLTPEKRVTANEHKLIVVKAIIAEKQLKLQPTYKVDINTEEEIL